MNVIKHVSSVVFLSMMLLFPGLIYAHGDVAPQPINTEGLEPLGEEWRERNPYSGNELAIKIGELAYGQNCARCHGIHAISGGINPDLRELEHNAENDAWYIMRVRKGAIRNGITYMPVFAESDGGPLSQEGLWAIWAWLETKVIEE